MLSSSVLDGWLETSVGPQMASCSVNSISPVSPHRSGPLRCRIKNLQSLKGQSAGQKGRGYRCGLHTGAAWAPPHPPKTWGLRGECYYVTLWHHPAPCQPLPFLGIKEEGNTATEPRAQGGKHFSEGKLPHLAQSIFFFICEYSFLVETRMNGWLPCELLGIHKENMLSIYFNILFQNFFVKQL